MKWIDITLPISEEYPDFKITVQTKTYMLK
jgi:hypothetical protein